MNQPAVIEPGAKVSLARRIKITLGISALGAVAGGIAGAIAAATVGAFMSGEATIYLDWFAYFMGAYIGAPLGAVLFPIAAWTLMRTVPFGRAAVGTIAGTLVGGFCGFFIAPGHNSLMISIGGGIIGFAVAAILLRLRAKAANTEPIIIN